MHILTKVFVLFASILSVLVAALAVSYGASASRIQADLSAAERAHKAADDAYKAQQSTHQRRVSELQLRIQSLEDSNSDLVSQIRALEGENAGLIIEKRNAEATADAITGRISQLSVTAQTQAELLRAYRGEVSELRDNELRWQSDKLDLEARLSDVESRNLVFVQTIRALREQVTELQSMLAAGDGFRPGRDTAAGSFGPATELSGPVVRGVVEEVRRESATGEMLIKINLGESDRIRKNTKLYIVRDGQTYLGDLVIFNTDLQFAVGRLENAEQGVTIRPGDQVFSKLSR